MAQITQLIDIERIIKEYRIKSFIETGTGAGESLEIVKNYNFELIQSCEIIEKQYNEVKDRFRDNRILIHLGASEDCLHKMIEVSNRPTLFFLDAHFPGQGYITHEYINRDYEMEKIIPLEKELNILKSWKHIVNSIVVIDDLRIYKKDNYQGGDWEEGRNKLGNPESLFLDVFLKETHNKVESKLQQGYMIYLPKHKRLVLSHRNTETLGDFATSFPILSTISKIHGPIDITLPPIYKEKYNGLKEFLEFQDFIGNIDYEDNESDVDIQCHPHKDGYKPNQTWYTKEMLEKQLRTKLEIDTTLQLKVPFLEIDKSTINKNIIIDRDKTQVLKRTNLFQNQEKNHWLSTTKENEEGETLIYNINVCLQNQKNIISTPTGLPILLQHFNLHFTMLQLDEPGIQARDFAYFESNKINWIDLT